ncbi:Gamma-tubulin complex component 6 [Phytophthora citrophthora]|uniref:Gamma-tubulin complex component 6 n=1 Tax=Phytophthora citrophthora TaxID=4793 RepID=A0AAD9GEC2_9STRA|nr:Gamma-tubulin complex component 6 [Phytophthora citrophthora]
MNEVRREAASDAGVVGLLKHLRSHICCESRSDFRRVLPVYRRLLSPRQDDSVSVQHELLEIRGKLLTCGENADVVDVVKHMDRVVERCMGFEDQQQDTETAVPMNEVMRLLVALAGGDDGDTFVLEDAMVLSEKSSLGFVAEKNRIGDRIQMDNIELMQRSKALFHKPPVSLQEPAWEPWLFEADRYLVATLHRLFSQDLFSIFGNGIPSKHTSLWCSNTTISEESGNLDMMPFQKRQRHEQNSMADVKSSNVLKMGKQTKSLLPWKEEVFFYDGTQELNCKGQTQPANWGEVSSITENSSWGSDMSLDGTEPWIARTYAWEDLGDRIGLHEQHAKPPVREEKRSLKDLVIPDIVACDGCVPLEIHEEDLIKDSLRALSGVDSTIFRRDFESATFQLPEIRKLKLRSTSVSATMNLLEVFRKTGTTVVRLEMLGIYYSQDSARGGKTLQAMGDALLHFLSTYRAIVEDIAQQCQTYEEEDEEEDILSVTTLVAKTRKVRRILEIIGRMFRCDEDMYWPLLQLGKFPRGIALLDHLYRYVSSLRVEDSLGHIQELVTWFLVKSCSPLLAVLSDLVSLGRVDESTDPFDEFELTMWSRNLLDKATAGGGDGLFGEELSIESVGMMPAFMGKIAPRIVHLSQVQTLLRSINAIASTHPLTFCDQIDMPSLVMFTHGEDISAHAEEWKAAIAGVTHPRYNKEPHTYVDDKMLPVAKELRLDFTREDREQFERKQKCQQQQRNLLDQQVLEKEQRRFELAHQNEVNDAKRTAEAAECRANEEAYGQKVLLNKYAVLMNEAEQRHDYMKWRRDRAVRLSSAKEQLQRIRIDDMAKWTADKEKQVEEAQSAVEKETGSSQIEEFVDVVAKSTKDVRKPSAASTDDSGWKASVRVNKEAGNRTTMDVDGCAWRAHVKVDHEAGSRSSMSDTDGVWRASVKVNKEAGSRSSGVFTDPATVENTSKRTGVRILNEPGGGGAAMYGTLYGGSQPATVAVALTEDVAMDAGTIDAERKAQVNEVPGDPIPETIEGEDVGGESLIHDAAIPLSTFHEELPSEDSEMVESEGEPTNYTRLSLPPVHPFFSSSLSREDTEALTQALAETTADPDFIFFESIVDCCVAFPVRLISDKLEQVAIEWFRSALQVVEHLKWLHRLMLMSEGLCMDIFARDFLRGLNSATRVNWGLEGRLTSALTMAMIEGSVEVDAIGQTFHYETTPTLSQGKYYLTYFWSMVYRSLSPHTCLIVLDSLTMTPGVASLLSELELVYDVKWPLGFLITSRSLVAYKQMHQFLLYVRLTSLEIRETWGVLRLIRRQKKLSPALDRICGGVVYKMQTFLLAFNETFSTKVLMTAWSELEQSIQKSTTLVQLRRCHETFVSVAARCCFLDDSTAEDARKLQVSSAFSDALASAWRLTGFLRALERQVTGRSSEGTRIVVLCEEFDVALQVLVRNLQSVAKKDAERSTREFSECFLLRLNFNRFYSTLDAPIATAADERMPGGASKDGVAEF